MPATSGATCMWVIAAVVVLVVAYMVCNGTGVGTAYGAAKPRAGGACQSRSGRAARRSFYGSNRSNSSKSTAQGTTLMSGEVVDDGSTDMVRIASGRMPGEEAVEYGDAFLQTSAVVEADDAYTPRSKMMEGGALGANTKPFQLSQSGRDSTGPSGQKIGFSTNSWLPQVQRPVGVACVSFQDSSFRQDQYAGLSQCRESGSCPDGMQADAGGM